jgi:hypothetical protein
MTPPGHRMRMMDSTKVYPAISVQTVAEERSLEPFGERAFVHERPYGVKDTHKAGDAKRDGGKYNPAFSLSIHFSSFSFPSERATFLSTAASFSLASVPQLPGPSQLRTGD